MTIFVRLSPGQLNTASVLLAVIIEEEWTLDKAKVIASVWGDKFVQLFAALNCFGSVDLEK